MFPSWDTLTTPPTPVYDLKTEPFRWVGLSLVVPVLQKERRAFREHGAEENPDRGIVHLHLAFDLKEGLDKSFV